MSLRKLSRRAPIADPQDLGIFATPWSALLSNLDTLADAHAHLASKIESDVEQPLRTFNTSNREMTSMANMQGNLAALAKDIDAAQKKVDKVGAKGTTQKAAAANSDLEHARSEWDSQAPYMFQSLQALDEVRLNHLRDVLTQLQTHEVDKVERTRIAAEQCLNILLSVETADEIKTFALRTSSSEPRPASAISRPQTLQSSASAMTLSPATPSAYADDRASQRSDSVSELPTPKPRGLRRLGTVLSRRRESKIPAGAGRISESPERATPDRKSRLPHSATFSSFSRSIGKSRDNVLGLEPPQEDQAERPRSPLRVMSSRSEAAGYTEERPTTNGTVGTSEAAPAIVNGSHQSDLAGLSLNEPPRQMSEAGISIAGSDAAQSSTDRNKSRELDPITAAEQEAASQEASNPAFKVAIKDAPAAQEEGDVEALTNMAATLKMQAPVAGGSRRQGTVRGRRDNRASIYDSPMALNLPSRIAETPIQEQPTAIMESPAQTETAAVPVASPQAAAPSPFGQGTPFPGVAGVGSAPQSPMYAPRPPSAQRDDAGSVRSGRSYGSTASASHRHPEQTAPGLNASIIETVSATFEQGNLVRSLVIGEVALTNNSDASSAESETIRLSNFSALEKVAPNPAFLVNSGSADSYALDLVHLGRGKPQIAFKYQLSSSAVASDSLAPIVLHPQWKIEPNQTSVIMTYGLNPKFSRAGQDTVTLKDLTLMLHLGEGSKAGSCLSKPVGTFNKERGIIYWSLGEVTLRQTDGPQKLLARFSTEGEARQGKTEARWTIEDAREDNVNEAAIELKRGEEDPFSDSEVERWVPLSAECVRKRLVAGSYIGS